MSPTEYEELYAANEDAAIVYRRGLLGREGEGPRAYLRERGFGELLDESPWSVGYAPASWTALHDHLSHLGYSDQTMLDAGLVTRTRRDTLVDRLRDRITFGIRDAEGRLCGFTARRGPGAPDSCPKYLNTPSTPIYRKSEQLFGLGEALSSPRYDGRVVLTEGPFDAIGVAVATRSGDKALAACGTALTPRHGEILAANGVHHMTLLFDADEAGRAALVRACTALAGTITRIESTRSSSGTDPAALFSAKGASGVRCLLHRRRPAVEVIIDQHIDSWPNRGRGAESDLCCLRDIANIRTVDAAAAASRLGARLSLPLETITRELVAASEARHESRPRRLVPHERDLPAEFLGAQSRYGAR